MDGVLCIHLHFARSRDLLKQVRLVRFRDKSTEPLGTLFSALSFADIVHVAVAARLLLLSRSCVNIVKVAGEEEERLNIRLFFAQ